KYSTSEINHNKSVTLVEMDGEGKVNINLMPLEPLRDYKKLTGLLKDVSSVGFYDKKEDYITVELQDEFLTENPFNLLSDIYPNLTGITFSNIDKSIENAPSEEIISKQDTYKLFSSFFESNYSREMDEDESRFIKDIISEVEESLNDPD
ncbi:MAG: exonuclease SbcCD subunit D C-terminal domain-containing protein, partial [Clostridiaceae bacterium]